MKLPRPLRCPSRIDGDRCDLPRLHGRRHHSRPAPGVSRWWSTESTRRQIYETDMPWITWTFLSLDRETRLTGRTRMKLTCCVCGRREIVRIRIPRWGPVPAPAGGIHPERDRAKGRHGHPGQQDPADWALPLRNPAAWQGGVPFSVFDNIARTARMEADNDGGSD